MNIWDKLTKAVLFLLIVAGCMAVCVWYLPLIRKNEQMRKELMELDTKIAREEECNKTLRTSVEAGHNDVKTIERLARKYLGYARTGEIVVRFETPAAVSVPPRR
jgi:cell division protein FtsB